MVDICTQTTLTTFYPSPDLQCHLHSHPPLDLQLPTHIRLTYSTYDLQHTPAYRPTRVNGVGNQHVSVGWVTNTCQWGGVGKQHVSVGWVNNTCPVGWVNNTCPVGWVNNTCPVGWVTTVPSYVRWSPSYVRWSPLLLFPRWCRVDG
jgi:hypothetical protein